MAFSRWWTPKGLDDFYNSNMNMWTIFCCLFGVQNLIQFAIHWIPFSSWVGKIIWFLSYFTSSELKYLNRHRNLTILAKKRPASGLCGANASRSSTYLEYGWCWFGCPCQIRPQLSLGWTKHGRKTMAFGKKSYSQRNDTMNIQDFWMVSSSKNRISLLTILV